MTASTEKRAAPAASPILALDYGRKRIGLAVSDASGVLPRPIETLVRKNRRDDIKRLREIARDNGARLLVVGHPLRLDGSRGDMAQEVERFAKRLENQLGLPVELMDERLTSWEAEQLEDQFAGPLAAALSGKGEKHGMDSVAAAIILRDYLQQRRGNSRNTVRANLRAKGRPQS
ncbi:MAG TPA: Holliday junction resolvase RuvX [Candidatus Dormibacteraeota bacterium]|nr:Holliday junction resolvase RuvX [Candidatus Dormibacteraeota bacterium]